MYACLAVTCHLHFWQNDRDFLRATVVTRGWNGYRKKSQPQKVDPGEENSPAVPAGIEPATFAGRMYFYFIFYTEYLPPPPPPWHYVVRATSPGVSPITFLNISIITNI